jgi:hypothetical protein
MAELAVTDGMPPPADLPDGECICTRLDDGTIRIDQADPRILISAPLLYEIADGRSPWASVSAEPPPREHWDGHGAMEGALLKIHGVNRTVIYRIGEYVPRVHGYIGEWPD